MQRSAEVPGLVLPDWRFLIRHASLLFLLLILALAGCGGPGVPATVSADVPVPATELRIAVLSDVTGSGLQTGVVPPAPEDFTDLVELLQATGGELAAGLINESSNRPLIRLRLARMPGRSTADDLAADPYTRSRLRRERDERYAAWKRTQEARISAFMEDLRGLDRAQVAGRTDVAGALARAELFLSEPTGATARKYIIVVSDGLDNVRAVPVPMTSGAGILLVNSSACLGVFAGLKVERFESFDAAKRYLLLARTGAEKHAVYY